MKRTAAKTTKQTGALLISIFLILALTVTNFAGAYHSAARVYAVEETDGGDDSQGEVQADNESEEGNAAEPPAAENNTSDTPEDIMPVTGNTATEGGSGAQNEENAAAPGGTAVSSAPENTDATTSENNATTPAETFTVTFDANGHGTAPDAVTVESGQTIAKPADPTAEGYIFTGWFCDAAATIAWNFDTNTVTENLTLYAGWIEIAPAQTSEASAPQGNTTANAQNSTTTPVLQSNNANNSDTATQDATRASQSDASTSVPQSNDTGNSGSTAQDEVTTPALQSNDMSDTGTTTKDDASNSGSTTPDDTATPAQQSDDTSNSDETTQDDTITPAPQENNTPAVSHTVTFDVNGHGTAPAPITAAHGDTITAPAAPSEDGFIFTGWYTEPEARNIWNFGKDTVTADLTLYAEWQEASRKDEDEPPASFPAFSQSTTVNGITVSAKAEEGAFPEGARLSVSAVYGSAQAQAEQKVEAVRSNDANVTASHTLDIKVLDENGEELQPADGHEVVLSFSSAQIADDSTKVSVYHIDGGHAQELAVSTQGNTATTVTDGFSYYVVQYSIDGSDLHYRFDHHGNIDVHIIMQALGFQVSASDIREVISSHSDVVRVSHKAWYGVDDWYVQWVSDSVPAGVSLAVTLTNGQSYSVKVEQAQPDTSGTIGDVPWSFYQNINGDGVLVISGNLSGNINYAPWFAFRSEVHEVIFEEGVTIARGTSVSQCNNLTYVKLPSTLKYFYGFDFKNCMSLRYFTYSGTVDDWKKVDGYSSRLPDGMYVQCTDGTFSNIKNNVTLEVKGTMSESNDSAEIVGKSTGILYGETVTVKVTTDLQEVESVIVKYPAGTSDTLSRDSIEGASELYRFTMGKANATVEVTFKPSEQHKITVATQGKGTAEVKPIYAFTADNLARAYTGMPLMVLLYPDEGYRINSLSGCTVTNLSNNTTVSVTYEGGYYTFRMPDAPVRVDVFFVPRMFYVKTVYDNSKGTVSTVGRTEADSTASFQVKPNSGYGIESITYTWNGNTNTIPVAAGQEWYSFVMPPADVTLNVTFKETPDAPRITTASLPRGYVGEAYSFAMTAEGKGAISWSASNLPDGLSISSQGVISGTPTTTRQLKTVTFTATNGSGSQNIKLDLYISEKYAITANVSPTVGGTVIGAGTYKEGETYTLTAISNEGYHFLGWYDENNEIVAINLTYSLNALSNRTFTAKFETSADGAPEIITTYLPHAYKGVYYEQTLAATGETPMTWKLVKGSLPDGLSFSSDGKISGTLTEEPLGSSRIFVKVSNQKGTDIREYWLAYGDNSFTVYYNVVNGTWADGSTERKEERVPDYTIPTQVPTPGDGSGAWNIDPTEKVIDRNYTFTYTFIQPYQPSGDATLLSLAGTGFSSAGEPDQSLALSPAFAPGTTSYTAQVDHAYDSVLIDAETTHYKATIGGDIGAQSLADGDNTFVINVTAEDGSTGNYTLTITRSAPVTKHTVTYVVENGTWSDGTGTAKTEKVEQGKKPSQIPTGMLAGSGYEGGAWDTDPSGVTITGDHTFTYFFTAKPVIPTVSYDVNVSVAAGQAGWGSVSGAGSYHENADATVSATPNPGYTFVCWKENGTPVETSADYTFKVTKARNLVAEFAQITPVQHTISVSVKSECAGMGTVLGGGVYNEGEQVTIQATPNTGYEFVTWEDGATGAVRTEPASFNHTVTGDAGYIAVFKKQDGQNPTPATQHRVTVGVASGQGGFGSVKGGGVYNKGDSVTVTATANTGYTFVRWLNGHTEFSTSATHTFTVDKNYDLIAEFKEDTTAQYTVNVSASHGGTVTGGGTFNENAFVKVEAKPDAGYQFKQWTENGAKVDGAGASYTFTLTADRTLTAEFELIPPTITGVTVSPATADVVKSGSQQFTASVSGTGMFNSAVTWTIAPTSGAFSDPDTKIDPDTGMLTIGENETVTQIRVTATSKEDTSVSGTATVTVKEKPQTKTFVVSFDSDGGSTVATQYVPDGTAATEPADPTRKGYTFVEWQLNGKAYDFNTPVTSDITLTAKWKQDANTLRHVDVRGFSEADIPQSLRDKGFNTVADIQNALLQAIIKNSGSAYGKNFALYEVQLMISLDGGTTWQAATPANFPSGGITVEIPYPSGTNGNTHNFAVSHMFTVAMRGHAPGDTETPKPNKTADGIQITLTGLSPVLVSWTEISNQSNPTNPSNPSNPSSPSGPTNPGGGGGSGGGSGSGSGSTPSPQATGSEGQNATGGTDTVATRTNVSGARSASGAQNTNARGGQTGDDMYERLGLHTLVLLAALTVLLASLRKLEEERGIMRSHVRRRRR